MQKELEQLAAGEISFDVFAIRTSEHWQRLAQSLYGKWKTQIPAGVGVEDIKQEMLFQAWFTLPEYDATRGKTLHQYVVFQASARASRFINMQRNAFRRSGSAPSRFPTSFATLGDASPEWFESLLPTDSVDFEDMVDASRRFERHLSEASSLSEVFTLTALKMTGGDIRRAGRMLFDETELRVYNRWNSEEAAINHVESSLSLCGV